MIFEEKDFSNIEQVFAGCRTSQVHDEDQLIRLIQLRREFIEKMKQANLLEDDKTDS